jgi:hypothetical protein
MAGALGFQMASLLQGTKWFLNHVQHCLCFKCQEIKCTIKNFHYLNSGHTCQCFKCQKNYCKTLLSFESRALLPSLQMVKSFLILKQSAVHVLSVPINWVVTVICKHVYSSSFQMTVSGIWVP